MQNYSPSNWYWIVGGSTTQVYSSAAAAYVPITDATYETWLAAGNSPTKIDNETDLGGVFAAAGCPQCWYKNAAQVAAAAALAAGLALTSTGTPALNGTYALSPTSLTQIAEVREDLLANGGTFSEGGASFVWADSAGSTHTFNPTNFAAFAAAVAKYVEAVEEYADTGTGSIPSNAVTIP